MRSYFFNKLIDQWEQEAPEQFRLMQIRILARMTAKAFGVPGVWFRTSSAGKALRKYAAFTKWCLENVDADPMRLYRVSYELGAKVRKVSGVTRREDRQRLVLFLYRNIGIFMDGRIPGEITVSKCFFSQGYTPAQCALISYIDSGVVAGICGGGKLVFSQRITEGCAQCKACFHKGGNHNE